MGQDWMNQNLNDVVVCIFVLIFGILICAYGVEVLVKKISDTRIAAAAASVPDDQIDRYCRLTGIGILLTGLGVSASAILDFIYLLELINDITIGACLLFAGICVGACMVLFAQAKYIWKKF